jgi:hypothetical protein
MINTYISAIYVMGVYVCVYISLTCFGVHRRTIKPLRELLKEK